MLTRRSAGTVAVAIALASCPELHSERARQRPAPKPALAPDAGHAPVGAPAVPRRVWTGDTVNLWGSPSPDGRMVSFSYGATGDLAVRDLATGHIRLLTDNQRSRSDGWAVTSTMSPDGNMIAYRWEVGDTLTQLRLIGLDGTPPRVLYSSPTAGGGMTPTDWTPDGRAVAATVLGRDTVWRIVLVPIDGTAARALKDFPKWRVPGNVRVSPNGKYLAYDYSSRKDDGKRAIAVLPTDGGRESVVVPPDDDSDLIGWTPDGSRLVFGNEHGGSPSIWSVRVDPGKANGDPILIRRDMWRARGLRLTSRGVLFFSVTTGDRDVRTASYDPVSGRLRSQPISVTGHPGEGYAHPAWSPDGHYISYITSNGPRVGRTSTITIRSAESREQIKVLQPKVEGVWAAIWAPDGKAMILLANDQAGRSTQLRLDLETTEVTPLADGAANEPAFSPDGHWMYYVPASGRLPLAPTESQSRLMAHNVASKVERVVYVAPEGTSIPSPTRIVVSPDGKRILFVTNVASNPRAHVLQTVDLTSGQARSVIEPAFESLGREVPRNRNVVGFSPDGRYVLFTAGGTGLWRVLPLGKPEQMPIALGGPPRLSPDGTRLLYVAGGVSLELWVLEDPNLGSRVTVPGPDR